MNESLRLETERLARSWMEHDAAMLRDYLVADVEDPRVNLQSVLTRHFLMRAVAGNACAGLMEQEGRFSAAINWLSGTAGGRRSPEESEVIRYALKLGADNAEGLEIPEFIQHAFASLPLQLGPWTIPNYVDGWLEEAVAATAGVPKQSSVLDTFQTLWRAALADDIESRLRPDGRQVASRPSVLEPACGSANDYRFFDAFGLAPHLDYTGFDLCPKNVANAQALFPNIRFACGNVFEINAPDRAFDWCVVHDLFEHLSLEGLEVAVHEIARVTRQGLCLGFFNMDEIRDHHERPLHEYYWNTLSMGRVRKAFEEQGFRGRVMHIGSYVGQVLGWHQTHNPNAYTFELYRACEPD